MLFGHSMHHKNDGTSHATTSFERILVHVDFHRVQLGHMLLPNFEVFSSRGLRTLLGPDDLL